MEILNTLTVALGKISVKTASFFSVSYWGHGHHILSESSCELPRLDMHDTLASLSRPSCVHTV